MNIKQALLYTGYIIRWETDVASFACASQAQDNTWLRSSRGRNNLTSRIYYFGVKQCFIVFSIKVRSIVKKQVKNMVFIWAGYQ